MSGRTPGSLPSLGHVAQSFVRLPLAFVRSAVVASVVRVAMLCGLFFSVTVATMPEASSDVIFLDITSLTPTSDTGGPLIQGGFSGTIGTVGVTGSLTNTNMSNFKIREAGTTFELSVINGTSQQFKYTDVYTHATANVDKVGYTFQNIGTLTPRLTINFTSPLYNPIFHVANVDSMTYSFLNSGGGLTGLSLLSGNGGSDGDGLQVSGFNIGDAKPTTVVAQGPGVHPHMAPTARYGYGSVMLLGNISYLQIDFSKVGGDGGGFTLSSSGMTVPEPSAVAALTLCMAFVGCARYQRNKQAAPLAKNDLKMPAQDV